jgi:hypothetical protein
MDIRSFDLNLLVVLQALISEQSVSRAATKLHLSQPATSKALATLSFNLDAALAYFLPKKPPNIFPSLAFLGATLPLAAAPLVVARSNSCFA